jgi:hypothetical protein
MSNILDEGIRTEEEKTTKVHPPLKRKRKTKTRNLLLCINKSDWINRI